MNTRRMTRYATICGSTPAHAHARSTDAVAIAGSLGTGDVSNRAITDFAFTYADLNDEHNEAFRTAIETGRIVAAER